MLENWKQGEDLPDKFLDLLHSRSEAIQNSKAIDFEKLEEIYIEAMDCIALTEICLENKIDFRLYKALKEQLF